MKAMFLSVLLTVFTCVSWAQDNLVVNGGMENWTGDVIDGYATAGSISLSKSADARTGFYALKVETTGDGGRFNPTVEMNLGAGNYVVSVWVKGKASFKWMTLTKVEAGLNPGQNFTEKNVGWYPMGKNGSSYPTDTIDDWKEYTSILTITQEGSYKVHCNVTKADDSALPFLMDDLSVKKAPYVPDVTAIKITDESADAGYNLCGFRKDIFDYIVPVSFNYNKTPVVNATLGSGLSQNVTPAESLDGRGLTTAKITVTSSEGIATYNNTFFTKQIHF